MTYKEMTFVKCEKCGKLLPADSKGYEIFYHPIHYFGDVTYEIHIICNKCIDKIKELGWEEGTKECAKKEK